MGEDIEHQTQFRHLGRSDIFGFSANVMTVARIFMTFSYFILLLLFDIMVMCDGHVGRPSLLFIVYCLRLRLA